MSRQQNLSRLKSAGLGIQSREAFTCSLPTLSASFSPGYLLISQTLISYVVIHMFHSGMMNDILFDLSPQYIPRQAIECILQTAVE